MPSPLTAALKVLWQRLTQPAEPIRPREVDRALEDVWDLEEYKRQGEGRAGPDAPRIDPGGI